MKQTSRAYFILMIGVAIACGRSASAQEVVPPPAHVNSAANSTEKPNLIADDSSGDGDWIVGQEQPSSGGGLFDDTAPAACEKCGGGGCLPATWTVENEAVIWGLSRANNQHLSTAVAPGGPFQVTSGTNGQAAQFEYINNATSSSQLEVHTLNFSVSPGWDLRLARFLGRDGEQRDHFIMFEFSGLNRWSTNQVVNGTTIPIYSQTPFTPPNGIGSSVNPTITGFTGSLNSPYPAPVFATDDPRFSQAFNGAQRQSASYTSTLENFELNYDIAARNQPDQLVMNPNGRWYRECQKGYYYNYLFGLRVMSIDEKFEFLSNGVSFDANGNPTHASHGRYVVRTWNTLYGIQTGGTLEYRFCRWSLDTHGKVGMYLNPAIQESHIQGIVDTVTTIDDPFKSNNSVVAFAGEFGVHGSYKFLPNFIGHISYDMMFVGDIARAAEQLDFIANPNPTLNTQGAAFYNGVKIGCELDW